MFPTGWDIFIMMSIANQEEMIQLTLENKNLDVHDIKEIDLLKRIAINQERKKERKKKKYLAAEKITIVVTSIQSHQRRHFKEILIFNERK